MSNESPPPPTISAEEMWIQPDPNGNPASLRFGIGSLVMYKMEEGWVEGEVLKVCMRLEIPPEFAGPNANQAPPILYLVWPHSDVPDDLLGSHWIHEDTDDFIRPRLQYRTWDRSTFNPTLVAPSDPLSHLYTGILFDPRTEEGTEIAQVYNSLDGIDSATTNPDGSVEITTNDRRTLTSSIMEIPHEPVLRVPGYVILQFATLLANRRPVSKDTHAVDFLRIFTEAAPSETRLSQLEAAAKKSSDKMLQLGDALMTGVHGWPRDPDRACRCYQAAAYGCQESELDGRIDFRVGLPVGNAEAMVAYANIVIQFMKKEVLRIDVHENVPASHLIERALQSDRHVGILQYLFYWLTAAANRSYVAPLTLSVADAIYGMRHLIRTHQAYPDFEGNLEVLIAVHEYNQLECSYKELQEKGDIPRGDPSEDILRLFSSKSISILMDLPVSSDNLHIEYRQIPRAPFPYVVYAIVPTKKKMIKVVRLPDYLQMCPFSEESFTYAWNRIAFELHLGDAITKKRERPAAFTVLDSHGNREFAEMLRNEINGSGTEVRLVSHEELIPTKTGRRSRRRDVQLGTIIHELQSRLMQIPNYLASESSDQNLTSETESNVNRVAHEIFIESDTDRSRTRVTEIKNQGNQLFGSSDFAGATRCYSIVIELLRLLSLSDDETNLLLGTTLSNRAACFLEMESQRTSVAFQKLLVQNAIRDCTSALKFSWASRVLPTRILDKLKFRRDKAEARLDVLQCDFQSEVASIIFPPPRGDRQRDEDNQEETGEGFLSDIAPVQDSGVPTAGQDSRLSEFVDDLMLETGKIIADNGLATNSKDGCPVCLRQFDAELSFVYSAVLPCQQHAVCVECLCSMKKQSDKEKKGICCPLCRFDFDSKTVQNLAYHIVEKSEVLSMLVEKFPAEREDSIEVAIKLLWKWDFRVDKVVDTIESILDDRASGAFFRTESDLNHEQKEEIYQQARRPVRLLQDRMNRLLEEQRTTFETSKLNKIDKQLRTVRSELATARLKARDDIYEHLNTVGSMGAQNADDAIQVDYHGLHVREMHSKYQELVQAILPVVKKVTVITGRGLHSTGGAGTSKLMRELKKKIEKDKNTRWQSIPNNPGALVVLWTAE